MWATSSLIVHGGDAGVERLEERGLVPVVGSRGCARRPRPSRARRPGLRRLRRGFAWRYPRPDHSDARHEPISVRADEGYSPDRPGRGGHDDRHRACDRHDRHATAGGDDRRGVRPYGRRTPRPRGAGRALPGRAADVPAARRAGRPAGPRPAEHSAWPQGDRVGMWSPNNAEWVYIQYAAAKVGAILVNINPAYQTEEVRYALAQSGCRALVSATGFKSSDYAADDRRGAPIVAGARACRAARHARLGCVDDCRRTASQRTSCRLASASLTQHRADQHPVHERNDRVPEGRDAEPPQPAEQRLLPRRRIPLHRGTTACASPCPSTTASGWSSATWPTSPTRPRRCCRRRRSSRLPRCRRWRPSVARACSACRRCSSPCSAHPDFHTFDLSSLRTGMMAGSPCPVEVMKQCVDEMHMSEVTIGYGMTETSPVSTQTSPDDPLDKRVGTVGRVLPHRADQGHRSRRPARRSASASPASSARRATR